MADSLPQPVSLAAEGGGFVLTCSACQWTRFYETRPDAGAGRHEHAKKCKGPKVKPEQTARPTSRMTWDDREGATWIDSL